MAKGLQARGQRGTDQARATGQQYGLWFDLSAFGPVLHIGFKNTLPISKQAFQLASHQSISTGWRKVVDAVQQTTTLAVVNRLEAVLMPPAAKRTFDLFIDEATVFS